MTFKHLFIPVFFLSFLSTQAQTTQTLRGTVVSATLQHPVAGALIRIENQSATALTDSSGQFAIPGVPTGRHTVLASHEQFETAVLHNVIIGSGKETVLSIGLTEKARTLSTVGIVAQRSRNRPVNEFSGASVRTFTVEETQRYAAAVNDPGRMATSFAGVTGTDDGNNQISVRGHAPNHMIWRMEGVDIPNPNHFSVPGTSGGGISILSAQVLGQSDFMTGAFSPEYGNALGGLFDLKLRKGNNRRREHTFQAGLLGLDLATEGPFSPKSRGSYLINYRYSTLGLLDKVGVDVGDGLTTFQDLSFNFSLPTARMGTFGLFGFGGLSRQIFKAETDTVKWENFWQRYNTRFSSNTGAVGLTHSIALGKSTRMYNVLSANGNRLSDRTGELNAQLHETPLFSARQDLTRLVLSSLLTTRISATATLRYGLTGTRHAYGMMQQQQNDLRELKTVLNEDGHAYTLQAFLQYRKKLGKTLTADLGMHSLWLSLNGRYSVEPRATITWRTNARNTLTLGLGRHSQMQPIGNYLALNAAGQPTGNRQLDFSRALHSVLGWECVLAKDLRIKTEAYFQHLYAIPVHAGRADAFSMLNVGNGYVTDSLRNGGSGRNRGIELTLDKAFTQGWYLLLSGSLYKSTYRGSDGIWRNTRWDAGHALALTAGREWERNRRDKQRIWSLNLKTTWAGGLRTTPIDLAASIAKGRAVEKEELSWTDKLPAYFRTDLRIARKTNHKGYTSTLSLDIQNVTNRRNEAGCYFEPRSGKIITYHGMSLIPVLAYKLEF